MIFNFPTQTPAMLDRDLDTLLAIGIDQVTWYPLMVSDSTRQKVTETLGRVDSRQEERFYHQIVGRLVPAYRFSSAWCFSREKAMIDEYIVDYDEYAGLGQRFHRLPGRRLLREHLRHPAATSPRSTGASCRLRPPASFPSGTGSATIF